MRYLIYLEAIQAIEALGPPARILSQEEVLLAIDRACRDTAA